MSKPFIEWRRLPRSIRTDTPEVSIDVWPFFESGGLVYRWTVYHKINRGYLSHGAEKTEDRACESALKASKI